MENQPLGLARKFLEQTSVSLFLTGKAGTGKTTFLHNLRADSPKRMIVVAPTGVAAINAGGVTIHSFFQLAPAPYVPESERGPTAGRRQEAMHFNRRKIALIRSIDLLVIDEISMVRADVLDAVSDILRRYRDRSRPFGGVQLLMIGDVQQLAPVVRDDEWALLGRFYRSPFFFDSKALRETPYASIELEHIYRQSDDRFIALLNRVREGHLDADTLSELNRRCAPGFDPPDGEGYVTLTSHNHTARAINEAKMQALATPPACFEAIVEGTFPEYLDPTDRSLTLREGAQVMFVKNDLSPQKRYYNGKIGTVTHLDGDRVEVTPQGESEPIVVEPAEWSNARYVIDPQTKEISEQIDGRFVQYPLKAAWAITIHKSQGLTFDKAVIDAADSFSHGQVYVALSRCRTLDGMVLRSPLGSRSIVSDTAVKAFCDRVAAARPGKEELDRYARAYYMELLDELFDFSALSRGLRKLQQLVFEQFGKVYPKLVSRWETDIVRYTTEITDVAGRFRGQLARISAACADCRRDALLAERIGKGACYFAEKDRDIVAPLLGASVVEADSKEVRKALGELLARAEEAYAVKEATLDAARSGFCVGTHLAARAKASLDAAQPSPGREAKVTAGEDVRFPALFERLRQWRRDEAQQQGVPAYVVMSQQALLGVANLLPGSAAELKRIKGVGEKFVGRYAAPVLDLVAEFRTKTGADIDFAAPEPAEAVRSPKEKKEKKPREDTRLATLRLLREGLSPAEVARQRGLTEQSVEGHIADLILAGELDAGQFVPPDVSDAIAAHLDRCPGEKLSTIRDSLGSGFTYRDIRFVRSAWLRGKG